MHHCSSKATWQRTPLGNPDSLAQVCSTLAMAMVFCCLIIWKSEEEGEGMQSLRWSPEIVSGGAHHPIASCWALGSHNATTCQFARWRASSSLRLLHRTWEHIVLLPQSFPPADVGDPTAFLHGSTCGCGSLESGPSGLNWGQVVGDPTSGLQWVWNCVGGPLHSQTMVYQLALL